MSEALLELRGLTVDFVLKPEGAKLFADYTAAHVGDYFAITLDSSVISAPVINSSIPNGQVEIQSGGIGGYPLEENLGTAPLRVGGVPPVQEQDVPSCGSRYVHTITSTSE